MYKSQAEFQKNRLWYNSVVTHVNNVIWQDIWYNRIKFLRFYIISRSRTIHYQNVVASTVISSDLYRMKYYSLKTDQLNIIDILFLYIQNIFQTIKIDKPEKYKYFERKFSNTLCRYTHTQLPGTYIRRLATPDCVTPASDNLPKSDKPDNVWRFLSFSLSLSLSPLTRNSIANVRLAIYHIILYTLSCPVRVCEQCQ